MGTEYILELKHISKSFPGVKALDDVTLCVRPGTVHSLMGENGAGKYINEMSVRYLFI